MTKSAMIKRGKLARSSGCNIETIRYYETIGLLNPPERTQTGHRLYGPEDQARLGFIQRGRNLGFSIDELRSLLSLVDSNDYSCGDVLAVTRKQIESVKKKIADLRKLQRTLNGISAQCKGGDMPDCPIIESLFEARP